MRRRRTFIIAEAGVNHNGELQIAKQLVDAAKHAGADGVKFQTFRAEELANRRAEKAQYQKVTTRGDESQLAMLKRLELSASDHSEIIRHCKRRRITFLSTPFERRSADLLEHLAVPLFKISSGDLTNLPLLKHIAKKRRPIILSTGMACLGEVEEALATIFATGNKKVRLMHCVTEYPAPFAEVNLTAMITMKQAFHLPVGYSDHTPGIEIAIAAVALGAEIIEKHLTLSRTMEGPDHKASLEPCEFKEMVTAIRHVEVSLGDGVKRLAPSEVKNVAIARKSVVAARELHAGDVITARHLTLKRPGFGVQPKDLEKLVGLRARRRIERDEVITWDKLK